MSPTWKIEVERNLPDDTNAYNLWVERLIVEATSQGTASFCGLVSALPGVYPAVVLKAVQRLAKSGIMSERLSDEWTREAGQKPCRVPISHNGETLPPSHPLDYEWRFTRRTADALCRAGQRFSGEGDTIALLGVPSLLQSGLLDFNNQNVVLLDRNEQALRSLAQITPEAQLLFWDALRDNLPVVRAGCVIVDAPWYPEYLQLFLWAASRLCTPGGCVLVSLPPIGTRPNIMQERADLLAWVQKASLCLVQWKAATLAYESPLFERNALGAAGITNYPVHWRRGDFAVFRLQGESSLPRPQMTVDTTQWSEYILRGVRMRVKQGEPKPFGVPSLLPLVQGDILPSVSRRDARRSQADVWTMGNRIFGCDNGQSLELLLNVLANDQSPVLSLQQGMRRCLTRQERETMAQTLSRLEKVVEVEQNEMALYGG